MRLYRAVRQLYLNKTEKSHTHTYTHKDISGFRYTAKAMQKENYTALKAYVRKEKAQFSHLNSRLKKLEKEEQNKPKENREKEIIKRRKQSN